jgi:hydrophobe/amphiphile efflux-1 (HAE1) family protein
MRFSHFFIDRPIFAAVISVLLTVIGIVSLRSLPLAEYPNIVPPTISVGAVYPGASPETIAETVAAPLEQAINGVDGMMYLSSNSTADGRVNIIVTFELGTDLDLAQVLVQNRVAQAEARLPEEVRRLGINVASQSPSLMMVVNLLSPQDRYDQLYLSNYAALNIRDELTRLPGVADAFIVGGANYAMRIWLQPEQMAARGLTAGDVVNALRGQNVQVAAGAVGAQPNPTGAANEMVVEAPGRLADPESFGDVVVSSTPEGGLIRVRDIARVEIGAEEYGTYAYVSGRVSVAMLVFQRPGSNALDVANEVHATLDRLRDEFPEGLDYAVPYDTTRFVADTIEKVRDTMIEAVLLVVLVVFIFLQSFRAAIIPIITIPVSIFGAFSLIAALGGSINTISMFGLILAIGIVVDDAIVVVENVERNLRAGMSPREAARRTMDEVGGALIAIALVLIAVFLPVAFIGGLAGEFYRQFALTIATATAISCLVSLTLAPAMAALLLRPHDPAHQRQGVLGKFFAWFNHHFEMLGQRYGRLTQRAVRMSALVLIVYGGLIALTIGGYTLSPKGFIPAMDRGYVFAAIQLPPGASLDRTREVTLDISNRLRQIEGVASDNAIIGFSGATNTNAANAGTIFLILDEFKDRHGAAETAAGIAQQMREALVSFEDAQIFVVEPPAVDAIGSGSGVKMMIQDRGGHGWGALADASFAMMMAANQTPGVAGAFTLYEARTPRLRLEVDRDRAEALNVPVTAVNEALEIYLGSAYVNDFNFLGRTYRVTAQADAPYRDEASDIGRMWVRSNSGEMIPLSALTHVSETAGPQRAPRYNLFNAAELNADAAPGTSTGQLIERLENVARTALPSGFDFEWTELAFIQRAESGGAIGIFLLAALFVFLVLAAQYESLTLPLAVIMVAPMAILGALAGGFLAGQDVNILTQVAFVVLIGLAAKNSVLIVEFAKQLEEREGLDRFAAAAKAAGLRLRPILMTSFAFILGVIPLVLATGAGSEQRIALGVAVFSGMIGVTVIGLVLTPVFYVLARTIAERLPKRAPSAQRTPAE